MIHQYQNNGYNIVLDVNSGAVHVVDQEAYDVIAVLNEMNAEHTPETLKAPETETVLKEKLGDRYTEEDLKDILDAVTELTEQGRLFTKDIYENLIGIVKQRKTVVKALCLHIAHDCNLACQYCFAEEGEYHGRRALMSYEVGKKALDFLVANSGSRRNLEVDFFGGEPLMNWKVVKELVAYGRELEKQYDKHFRFTLTTNGVLLNEEVQEFVNREMDNVVLSLDGRKEVNDRMRPFRNGKGSYDLIVPKFQKLAESRNQQKYYIRGTFTRNNLDFSKDVEHFADLGFEQVSIEPVVGEDTDPYAIQKEDLPQIFEEYDRLAEIHKKPLTGYQKQALELNNYAAGHKREIRRADYGMTAEKQNVSRIKLERLKTHAMVDAQGAADDIMDAANDEIIGMLVQEVKDQQDEKMDEAKEKADEAMKEKEKREEKLDEMKLERAIERAMIEGTDEAVEEAERIKRQNDSPDIQMTDMVDLADSADLKKSVDQNLGDIKSSMKVLEADLKGIKVDEKA